jgi:hypothetical protein
MGKDKDGKAGSVALFNHADISRSDAEKIQCWCRLVRAAAAEKFPMLLVFVLFTENINVSDGFGGLTKNTALNSGMRTMWSYTSLSMLPENQRERAVRRRIIGSNE